MNFSFNDLGGSLFDISPNMIIVVEDDAILASANPFALAELGYEAENITGKKLSDLFVIPEIEGGMSATEIMNWLVSQYKTNDFIEVKASNGRVFKSRANIGGSMECADGRFRRVICIQDSGELDGAKAEQDTIVMMYIRFEGLTRVTIDADVIDLTCRLSSRPEHGRDVT